MDRPQPRSPCAAGGAGHSGVRNDGGKLSLGKRAWQGGKVFTFVLVSHYPNLV